MGTELNVNDDRLKRIITIARQYSPMVRRLTNGCMRQRAILEEAVRLAESLSVGPELYRFGRQVRIGDLEICSDRIEIEDADSE